MTTQGATSEGPARPRPWRSLALGAAVAGVVALAAGIGYWETRAVERRRHEVLEEVRQIERAIRKHDQAFWMRVEGQHPPSEVQASDEAHRQMLEDFDRLGHLEGFEMLDERFHIQADEAVITYRVAGLPGVRRRPAPARGELRLRRQADGRWHASAHRLFEAP